MLTRKKYFKRTEDEATEDAIIQTEKSDVKFSVYLQ